MFLVGLLHADADRVAEVVDLMGAATDKRVMLVIELEKVRANVAQGDHSLNLRRLNLNIHSPLCETGDVTVELVAYLVLHEFNKLVLDARALGLGGDHFTLGSVLACGLVSLAVGTLSSGEIGSEKAVNHHVRVAADRRGEMGVIGEREAVVTDVVDVVACLRHRAERKKLDGVELRLILRRVEEAVQLAGELLAIGYLAEIVAEIAHKSAQVVNFCHVRLVVYTIDKGLFFLPTLCRSLSGDRITILVKICPRSNKFRHTTVGKQHKLLDEPVCLL